MPFLNIIMLVIQLYIWIVIASAILSWLIAFNVVNTQNRFVFTVADMLYRMTEPAMRPIRRVLPDLGGLDLSPVVLILGLILLQDIIAYYVAPALMGY
ncbi:conserved protein [Tepidicaulis marinus]|jgi:YggT family protein|uniref:Conserved protein n=1 Tax=Tepidicaulis marinus TaxID=1333998 RepID=A0A081B836_9HYPH|nr:YggT family protein [Tepidicaulis marinus]GAK44204.1 conserved protein [Tepidicaulis marinus]